ncbi:MAG: membrane protein insertion efficiency factor YidD [Candidatus Synoicihabitans palmerolidicus]|nr:membrane protein insertion efficiency factor YidD [Candidatus Synoicihabitans palmerolidicus]
MRIFQTLVALPARGLLGLIRGYQCAISPILPALFGPNYGCRFHPTCSHYAAGAIREHGAVFGTGLAVGRLLKCTPFHPDGFDPVPPARRLRPKCVRANSAAQVR